jgi:minor extracellular serine protease Vpr
LRRLLPLFAIVAACASATSAAASLQPIRRTFGDTTLPRLRAGKVVIPAGHARGRVRVIATLRLPPLAAAYGRGLAAVGGARRLDVRSAGSREYLARVAAAQRAARAELARSIPSARVGRSFRIVVDGLTIDLPVTQLPKLVRLGFVARVYPSLRYTLTLDRGPSVIGADAAERAAARGGAGIKIAIVDDGLDQTNPFFDPAGFSYPAGFPRGDSRFVSPKVIVAKSFPGPGAGAAGQLPVDRSSSFHATHVAGIAAGDEGTNAPAGRDHPAVLGLSGVAPKAWLGNYRVFTVPTPIGHVANSPEIVAAFEAAVADGMNVINFSGGGPETDPANDILVPAVHNVAQAGVVPVIAAGNDREDFGLGTAGSPGTAPDAISVAAVSNSHVFSAGLSVSGADVPAALREIPIQTGYATPLAWATGDQTLVDVGSIVGTSGQPVERHLCGSGGQVNDAASTQLPAGSLSGAIALASRGTCTFASKADRARAAGAVGLVLVDNRFGEANPIPITLSLPAGMVADLDGARLRDYAASHGGRATIRVGREPLELETGRSGIVTSFSSAGPTAFGHLLKPDVAAPGAQVLSSTLPEFAGSSFAVFDGTSMATPHVSGAAALLLELHPTWTAQQVKSALVSTAGPAWGDTARVREAPVVLEGGGLVNVPRAEDPLVFTDPVSLSFGDLNVNAGAKSATKLVQVADAGGGAGTWQVGLVPQAASADALVDVGAPLAIAPGGLAALSVTVRAGANAAAGANYGFIVLRNGDATRRIPYLFLVTRPVLESVQPKRLVKLQSGSTLNGTSRVDQYLYPSAPFGPAPDYVGAPMHETGAETLYETQVTTAVANVGVAVDLASANARIDPFFLGSKDENDVEGYAGTPTNVNGLTFDFEIPIGAAGASFPRPQTFYVSVDSGTDEFTGQNLPGTYRLRSWVNDVKPPTAKLLTTTVARGRPTIAARILDAAAGVDPLSLAIGYSNVLVGAAAYDPVSGLALFPLPTAAPQLTRKTAGTLVASDYQEAKNVNTAGDNIMPNTVFKAVTLNVVSRPTIAWVAPVAGRCATKPTTQLVAVASSTAMLRSVTFRDGAKRIAAIKRGTAGIFGANWRTKAAKKGKHTLRATARDARGRTVSATQTVRVC